MFETKNIYRSHTNLLFHGSFHQWNNEPTKFWGNEPTNGAKFGGSGDTLEKILPADLYELEKQPKRKVGGGNFLL